MGISMILILYLNPYDVNNPVRFPCMFYTFTINILHFILILPYLFRGYRLLTIFNIKYFNSNFYKSRLREAFYLKILCIVTGVLMITYVFAYLTDKIENVFAIDIELCLKDTKENLYLSFRIIWLIIHILESIALIYLVIRLRTIKDEFSISLELLSVALVWLGFEFLIISNSSLGYFLSQTVVLVLDIIRNYLIIIVSGLIPLIKSFQVLNIPICTTKECAANFHLLLITEKTYDAFYKFLLKQMKEGAKLLSFWTELNVFKHSKGQSQVRILSTDIYEKYLNPNSVLYIEFPNHLLGSIHSSYKSSSKDAYSEVFDGLGEYAYHMLRDYFYPHFKMSEDFKELEGELEKDEIAYSRLVASSMISSTEIE